MKLLRKIVAAISVSLVGYANATPVLIGATDLDFWASGSPNTIAGRWSADPIVLGDGSSLHFFKVELTELTSTFGNPIGIAFDNYVPWNGSSLALCSNWLACVTDAIVGNVGIYDPSLPTFRYPSDWTFLNRLLEGQDPIGSLHNTTIVYSSGGPYASASGTLHIEAWGTAPVSTVPAPPAFILMLTGLGLVGVMTRR